MIEPFLPLFTFAAISTITPGGATTLATASGAHFGFRRSLPLMTGIAAGLATMGAAAAAGLAGLILALPSVQLAMKAAGSLYLLWLAWRIASSGSPNLDRNLARPTSFIGGVLLLWQNPKAWAMTMGAAASFAALASGPSTLALLLGATFGVAATISLSLWCMAGQLLARLLTNEWQWRAINILLGLILAASIVPMWLD